MRSKPTVMKFGGTSVENVDAFRNVAAIAKSAVNSQPLIVVSAIAGLTDSLLKSVERAIAGDAKGATRSLDPDLARHNAIARELLNAEAAAAFEQTVGAARSEIRQLHKIIAAHPVTSPPLQDEIVAFGEHLSSQLLAAILREVGLAARYVDARRCIRTNEDYGNAAPQAGTNEATSAEVSPLLPAAKI